MNSSAPWRIWLAGVCLALAGSIWSATEGGSCEDCRDAAALVGGLDLGWFGVGFYGVLAAGIWLRSGRSRVACRLTFAAAGVHIVLLSLLLKAGVLCPPCQTAALGAFIAVGACLAQSDFRFSRDGWPLPAAALALLLTILPVQQARAREHERLGKALLARILTEQPTIEDGRVRLLLFSRDDCRHCADFKNRCLSELSREAGDRLLVAERPASANLPAPTVILLGNPPSVLVGKQPCGTYLKMLEKTSATARKDRTLTALPPTPQSNVRG